MLTVVIVIHLMLVLGLIGVVLLQKSEGGGLVSSTSGFMTGRGTANVLTRTTALLAVGFFITSLALSMACRTRPPSGLDHQSRRRAGFRGAAGRAGSTAQPDRQRRSRSAWWQHPAGRSRSVVWRAPSPALAIGSEPCRA